MPSTTPILMWKHNSLSRGEGQFKITALAAAVYILFTLISTFTSICAPRAKVLLAHGSVLHDVDVIYRESRDPSIATLVTFDDQEYPMAKCLDGSPGSMYISYGPPGSTGWIIMHSGGGWCTGLSDCCVRATTSLGTSVFNNRTMDMNIPGFALGYLSRDPTNNPVMSNYTIAILNYCDGASFAGALDTPVEDVCTTFPGKTVNSSAQQNEFDDNLK